MPSTKSFHVIYYQEKLQQIKRWPIQFAIQTRNIGIITKAWDGKPQSNFRCIYISCNDCYPKIAMGNRHNYDLCKLPTKKSCRHSYCFWIDFDSAYIDSLNAFPISAEAFLFYRSKANYRLAEDDMYDKSGMSLLQSGTKCYRLLIEPCNLTIANNLFKNIGDKWQKERRDANYILPPLVENYDRLLNFHWIFNGI